MAVSGNPRPKCPGRDPQRDPSRATDGAANGAPMGPRMGPAWDLLCPGPPSLFLHPAVHPCSHLPPLVGHMGPWGHGPIGSWAHGPVSPWAHGFVGQRGPRAHGGHGPMGRWAHGPNGPHGPEKRSCRGGIRRVYAATAAAAAAAVATAAVVSAAAVATYVGFDMEVSMWGAKCVVFH